MVPSIEWALDLIRLKEMPEHIINHSKTVRLVALKIAILIPDKIDVGLVEAGALLHDICKMDSIRTGQDHASMGGRLLDILGCPEVAFIVRRHVMLDSHELNEAMIVNYADKRVMHEEIVSLSRRFEDLVDRYGKDEKRKELIRGLYAGNVEIERIIAGATGMDVERINDLNLVKGDDLLDAAEGVRRQGGTAEFKRQGM